MIKTFFPLLMILSMLISGCINRTPPPPTVSPTQLNNALNETEMRLAKTMQQQCQAWEDQQQKNTEQFQKLQNNHQQIDEKLGTINQKLDKLPTKQVVAAASKTAECPSMPTSNNKLGNKMVVGQVEWLWIESLNRVYEARIDTGATTSSISALDITPFEKDGKRWVRFRMTPDDSDDSYEIEAPLVRYVKIRQASTDELDRRAVASLTIRMGNMTEIAEFTLTDRTQMSYPILLGREFLKDIAVVDVAKDNIQPKPEILKDLTQPKSVSKTNKK
ncbi:ATP-dependent zinc protease family protein [Methylophaga sp.]|uniref:ATP-dependent zinc protease family protein n=1 Tax=Methylophaga sp. TaxID=2024840 RepID=UPI003F69EEBD